MAEDADTDRRALCGRPFPLAKLRPLGVMTHGTVAVLRVDHPGLAPGETSSETGTIGGRRGAQEVGQG